jgi:hypothetical protein
VVVVIVLITKKVKYTITVVIIRVIATAGVQGSARETTLPLNPKRLNIG